MKLHGVFILNSIEQLLNASYHVYLNGKDYFELTPTVPNDPCNNFSVCIADDQDIHVMASLNMDDSRSRNEQGERIFYADMLFSYEQYPIFSGFLHLLAHAIEADNQSRCSSVLELDGKTVKTLVDDIIAQHDYPTIEHHKIYSCVQDDNGGDMSSALELSFTPEGAYLKVNSLDSLRFRTYYGGGKKHRVRNVLSLLCYLIEHQKT